jgi:hypothetical protein
LVALLADAALQLHAAPLLHHVRCLVGRGVQVGLRRKADAVAGGEGRGAHRRARLGGATAYVRLDAADIVPTERVLNAVGVRKCGRRILGAVRCGLVDTGLVRQRTFRTETHLYLRVGEVRSLGLVCGFGARGLVLVTHRSRLRLDGVVLDLGASLFVHVRGPAHPRIPMQGCLVGNESIHNTGALRWIFRRLQVFPAGPRDPWDSGSFRAIEQRR